MKELGILLAAMLGVLWVTPCPATLTDDLDDHLRSPALSQPRSYSQPENKAITRSYIVEKWGPLAGVEQKVDVVEYKTSTTEQLAELLDGEERFVLFSQTFEQSYRGTLYEGKNYVLIVKGLKWGSDADRPILLGTHYDSVSTSPGTDDNGSGMAAMLEVSKEIAKDEQSDYSAIFVAFDSEETGIYGSKQFVSGVFVPRLLDHYGIPPGNFMGAIILDTIMNFDETENSQHVPDADIFKIIFGEEYKRIEERKFSGHFLLGIGRFDEEKLAENVQNSWSTSGPGDFEDLTLPLTGNDVPPAYASVIDDYLRSDHKSFWMEESVQGGLKALFLTDTAELRGNMKECYHKSCDNVDTITPKKLEFLTQTTTSLIQTMRSAMNPNKTPTDGPTEPPPTAKTTPKKPKTNTASKTASSTVYVVLLATAFAHCIML